MRKVSWIILMLATLLVILGSLASAGIAYFAAPSNDLITSAISLEDLNLEEDAATALRGRRGTAAAFALGFATLVLFVVLVPYRRGEVWAWWAVLTAFLVLCVTVVLRLAALGTSQGMATALILCGVVLLGLLLDVGRILPNR